MPVCKTRRAAQLYESFSKRIASDLAFARLKVHHISPHSLSLSRGVYASAAEEKMARATEYSAVKRSLSRDDIVIADGLNYIKGFRYQLYCEAKAVSTPSCVIHIGTPESTCRELNARRLGQPSSNASDEHYEDSVFDDLIRRYEEPTGMNRWDRPLFTVLFDDETPPVDDIWDAVVGSGARSKTVKPNQATILVQPEAAPPNALSIISSTTQRIVTLVLSHQADNPGGQVPLDSLDRTVRLPAAAPVTLPQLQRLRRQFVNLNKQGAALGGDEIRIGALFVDFLNDALDT
ncbi:MAG: hypothetical protein M1825_002699 [Sarcosagium campestre]|nr:MAG: hypothetical protein M1825_002699 [Sarcosagium campestre]